jgi:molybdenum cofactor synthesis domain-containing protein
MIKDFKIAVLTISDRSSAGIRSDLSGPKIIEFLQKNNYEVTFYDIVPDEISRIKEKLIYISDELNIPLIFTTGGTGFTPRDVTPEATKLVIDKEAPGISDYIRQKSIAITPHAMLSRGISGIRKTSLIINLPGSPKAAVESIDFILETIPHAIELIQNNPDSEKNH